MEAGLRAAPVKRGSIVEHGYEVASVDMALPPPGQGVPFSKVDLTELRPGARGVLRHRRPVQESNRHRPSGGDPGAGPGAERHVIFETNVISTYNVFEAARVLGIKNVVWASSETVLGLPFETPPPYVPDRRGLSRPAGNGLFLSKFLGEEMAKEFCRWDPELKIFGLRFSNVIAPGATSNSRPSTPISTRANGTSGLTSTCR